MSVSPMDFYSRFFQMMFDNRNIISISKGFQAFFGDPETDDPSQTDFIFDQEVFDIDIIKGHKPVAVMIPRGIVTGNIIDDPLETEQQFTEFNRTIPLAQATGFINAGKLTKRISGEPPYSNFTREQRLRILTGRQHMSKIRQHMALFELLASLSIMEGKMPAILGTSDPKLIYDFRREPGNIIDVTQDWVAATLAKVLADIDEISDAVSQHGKVNPDMFLIEREVWGPFLLKDGLDKYFTPFGLNQGKISLSEPLPDRFQKFVGPGGFLFRGKLVTPQGRELHLFSYDQFYTEDEGATFKYFMPRGTALAAYSGARCDRVFGPGETLPITRVKTMWYEDMFGFTPSSLPMPENTPNGNIFIPEMFHFHAYPSADESTIKTKTQTGPVFVPTQTDGFGTLKGLLPAPP